MALRSKSFGAMLPRLDFHGSLRAAVLADRKTATTRLAGELDPNSELDELKPGARCAATSPRSPCTPRWTTASTAC